MALIGTGISYILLGTAESILFLSLARVPSGESIYLLFFMLLYFCVTLFGEEFMK